MIKENIKLKKAIESFWEYYIGDDEWRHFKGINSRGFDEAACIYSYGYENGGCGLRIDDGEEMTFPDLWSAKVFGYMVFTYKKYGVYF